MKTLNPRILVLALLVVSACKKDDTSTTTNAITTDEAADMVSSSLAKNSNGASLLFTQSAAVSKSIMGYRKSTPVCGTTVDTTLSIASTAGSIVTYAYNLTYGYELTCSQLGIPKNINVTCDYTGQFATTRLSSSNTGKATFVFSDILSTSASYKINGTFTREGSFESKVLNKNASTSKLTITFTNIAIDKETYVILSGEATIALSGTVTNKGDFNFTADVVYEGNGVATFAINDKVYSISLATGATED